MELKSILRIDFAHNKGGGGGREDSYLNIVEFPNFSDFSESKVWFVFIYKHIANQNGVRFSVSISQVQNVNKMFAYITDFISTLSNKMTKTSNLMVTNTRMFLVYFTSNNVIL